MTQNTIKSRLEKSIKYRPTRRERRKLKGYEDAGALYWTADMEKILRGLHARERVFLIAAVIEAVFLAGFILRGAGVL